LESDSYKLSQPSIEEYCQINRDNINIVAPPIRERNGNFDLKETPFSIRMRQKIINNEKIPSHSV
jgi:hypothetical protein